MLSNDSRDGQAAAVLFSAGLDSAVLLAVAAAAAPVQPIYVSAGLAWEAAERAAAERLLDAPPYRDRVRPMTTLTVDMGDVYPASHWAIRGTAPAFDTPDEDVYLEGRNIVLLSKTSVYMMRHGLRRVLMGQLAGNPFPDATPPFFDAIAHALTLGLAAPIEVVAPFSMLHKADVVRKGAALGVPFELTLSCMQPEDGLHCGRCSKCRERRDAFREAAIPDPTQYRTKPAR